MPWQSCWQHENKIPRNFHQLGKLAMQTPHTFNSCFSAGSLSDIASSTTDSLGLLLEVVRAEMPAEIGVATWRRVESEIRHQYGGRDHYIARSAGTPARLEDVKRLLQQKPGIKTVDIAEELEISARRVRQLLAMLRQSQG